MAGELEQFCDFGVQFNDLMFKVIALIPSLSHCLMKLIQYWKFLELLTLYNVFLPSICMGKHTGTILCGRNA